MTHAPLRGVLLTAGAVLLFALMDSTTKYLAGFFAVPMIMAVRYGVTLLLMLGTAYPRQGNGLFRTQRTGLVALRSMCLVVASLFLGLALHRMPVAETTAIMFLGPLLVVAVAGPLLGEKAGLWGVAAALGGFAGVLLIVRPGSGLDGLGVVFLAINVVANVAYAILSRLLAPTESAITLLFYTALAGTIAFGATLPWTLGTVMPSMLQGALLVGLGVAGGLGHFAYTAAFRHAPASFLAPVNYLQLVWAGLLGWLVFDHVPDLVTIAGMAIVTASGVSVALRATRKTVAPAEAIGGV